MPASVLEWGVRLILALQGWGKWLVGPMNVITFTGSTEFYLLIMPALYWCWNSRLGLRTGVGLLLSASLNSILKLALHDPRPYWFDPRVQLLTGAETSFGLPSGHSQTAAMVWGIAGAYLRRGWGWALVAVAIALVGFSRAFLGVHFPTDVFLGWAIGLLALVLFLQLETPVTKWMKARSPVQQIVLLFVLSLIIVLAGALASRSVSATWQLPSAWARNANAQAPHEPFNPLSIDGLVLGAGAFYGLTAGAVWMVSTGRSFDPGGPWLKRLGRYLVGVVGVLILWQGLGAFFSLLVEDETALGYALRFVRYALIGAWVSAGGPLAFVRLGLAQAESDRDQG
ncbi:MAG: phosphatase PAP2 family protein [Anaerolineae bacterium]|nr:phosphatase PAP2 family protein [Anaerolineae bacterium]